MWQVSTLSYYPVEDQMQDSVMVTSVSWKAYHSNGSSVAAKNGTYILDSDEVAYYDSAGMVTTLTQTEIFTDILSAIPDKPQWMLDVDSDLSVRLAAEQARPKTHTVLDKQFLGI